MSEKDKMSGEKMFIDAWSAAWKIHRLVRLHLHQAAARQVIIARAILVSDNSVGTDAIMWKVPKIVEEDRQMEPVARLTVK